MAGMSQRLPWRFRASSLPLESRDARDQQRTSEQISRLKRRAERTRGIEGETRKRSEQREGGKKIVACMCWNRKKACVGVY